MGGCCNIGILQDIGIQLLRHLLPLICGLRSSSALEQHPRTGIEQPFTSSLPQNIETFCIDQRLLAIRDARVYTMISSLAFPVAGLGSSTWNQLGL